MPEVKAVLAEHFEGRPISSQNIYEWKWGGYRDWLHHQQILDNKRELAADAKDLANTAPEMADSLFGLLTIDYGHLMMNRDKEEPEQFEKKRKVLSTLAQDIVRLRRCHLNARSVQIQETRMDNETEKTDEQLLLKFREWTQNPEVRKALILAPMERDRQLRILSDLPPAPEDPLVERETQNDPYFSHFDQNKTETKPNKTENSNPESDSPPPPAPENAPDAQTPDDAVGPRSTAADTNSGEAAEIGRARSPSAPQEKAEAPANAADSSGASVPASRSNQSTTQETALESNDDVSHPIASPSPGGEGRGEGELNISTDSNIIPHSDGGAPESNPELNTQNSKLESAPPSNAPTLNYSGRTTQDLIAEAEDNYACQKADRLQRASERTSASNDHVNRTNASPSPGGEGWGEGELNTNQSVQPKSRHISDYEKALLEGKTHEEAIYAQFAPLPKSEDMQPEALGPRLGWGEGICDHVDDPLPVQPQPPLRPYNLRPRWPLG
jgi:hypothetical protein